MKKFLSLVLALVMTMSLVTISAGAKDYADSKDITYNEAVDVLSELGILKGDANGFRPNGTLKRSEAAKIICSLSLTPKVADTLSTDTAPFADVPASHWAAGYIAECVSSGIINGVGGGKFAPDAEVTGYQFLKMLLGCLDYDATAEGLTGANWAVNVAKLANKLELTDGNDDFAGSKAITREEAALYALNTLKSKYVTEYDGGTGVGITIGDVVISTGAGKAKLSTKTFGEENYKLVEKKNVTDDLGRPAHKWERDGKKICEVYADAAAEKIVLTKAVADLVKYLDDEKILEDSKYVTGVDYTVNGSAAATDTNLKAGSVVEIFTNDADEITAVSVVNYEIGKITKVSTTVTKAEKEDGTAAKITVAGSIIKDNEFAGYDADTYTKDTYILYVKKAGSNKIIASELAESIEGKVDAKSGTKVRIDGTYYTDTTNSIKIKDEGTFYLNAAGQIMKSDAKTTASDKFALVYAVATEKKANADGVEDTIKTAYVVLTDGTKTSYVVSDDTDVAPVKDNVYPYSINSDGEIEFEDVSKRTDDITITNAASQKIDKNNSVVKGDELLTSTEFIFAYWNTAKTKLTTKTATSYKNVNVTADVVVVADDGEALYVFVTAKNGALASDAKYAVLLDKDYVTTEDEDDNVYYTYTFAVDGEETELTAKKANGIDKLVEGAVYSYTMSGEYAQDFAQVASKTVTSANDEYFRADGSRYEFDEETIYTITKEYDVEGALDTVTVSEGGEVAKDDEVVVIMKDSKLNIVFVYEEIK